MKEQKRMLIKIYLPYFSLLSNDFNEPKAHTALYPHVNF